MTRTFQVFRDKQQGEMNAGNTHPLKVTSVIYRIQASYDFRFLAVSNNLVSILFSYVIH